MPIMSDRQEIERARLELAQPEIEKLDELERENVMAYEDGIITTGVGDSVLTPAQVVGLLAERRRIIELRSRLSGALPTEVVNGSDYER